MLEKLKQFDAYSKTSDEYRVKTFGGATITLISSAIILLLFLSELSYYLSIDVKQELYVDTSRGSKLQINVDVVFHSAPCLYLSVDIMDVSGEHQLDVEKTMFKERLTLTGSKIIEDETPESKETQVKNPVDPNQCGSCYGAETAGKKCCNTCEDVREAYRLKGWAFSDPHSIEQCVNEGWTAQIKEQMNEGCRVYGTIDVSKVAGNFHFAPGKSFQQHSVHVHDLQPFGVKLFNMSHTINKLSFGREYPGIINPLNGHTEMDTESKQGGIMFQYFVKVVPTLYHHLNGELMDTNQFAVTKHTRTVRAATGEQGLPGVFIIYDISPIMVQLSEYQHSLTHFLTNICAIVGGVFTVAGMIDGLFYHSSRAFKKKVELGKWT